MTQYTLIKESNGKNWWIYTVENNEYIYQGSYVHNTLRVRDEKKSYKYKTFTDMELLGLISFDSDYKVTIIGEIAANKLLKKE